MLKKKSIILLSALLIFISASCKEKTPKEFLNNVVVNKEEYKKDSIEIIRQLKGFIVGHENFFYSKEYYDSTQLIIDSIIYSTDLNKMVVFLITKNPTSRQLIPDDKYIWYYDATCYLGIRQEGSIILSLIGPSFSNSNDKDKLRQMMHDTYFSEYAQIKDTNGEFRYKYNIGDVRFWDCPIWKEIEEERQKKKEFDEFKNKYPEDVYEPNKK
jgi:hypothetical protein